jgi:hypothetical protein
MQPGAERRVVVDACGDGDEEPVIEGQLLLREEARGLLLGRRLGAARNRGRGDRSHAGGAKVRPDGVGPPERIRQILHA